MNKDNTTPTEIGKDCTSANDTSLFSPEASRRAREQSSINPKSSTKENKSSDSIADSTTDNTTSTILPKEETSEQVNHRMVLNKPTTLIL